VNPPQSSGRCGTPGFLRHSPVDARQEIGELRGRNRHDAVRDGGPQKPPALKPLHEQARPVAVMPNQLDQVASAPPEDPQITGMRIAPERLLHHQRQGAEALAHIRVPRRQPHPRPARKRNHRKRSGAVSAPITFANVDASGAPSIVMRTSTPNAIVIEDRAGGGEENGDGGVHAGALAGPASLASGATRTGTNAGVLSCAPLSSRRQRYRRLAQSALRAISVTTAPGSSIAATSRAFSAVLHRRRRSTDVMTSMRLMVANLVLATLSYVASSTRKAARPGRILHNADELMSAIVRQAPGRAPGAIRLRRHEEAADWRRGGAGSRVRELSRLARPPP